MNRKWLAVGIILLFIGVVAAPSVNSKVIESTPQNLLHNRYRVCGIGYVSFMYRFNSIWHIEHDFDFMNNSIGWYYKLKLYVDNEKDMNGQWYCFFIKDLNSKVVYDRTKLPIQFYIYNFTGYLSLGNYSIPHGPWGYCFKIFGVANDFKAVLSK
ncbi:MAG TPA: hypothetical protein VMT57_00165 [Candidatus Thermoplasmatota archaeon]|nr:hypothetical protein [Candidatus Thermoplasmatota archaeon]